MITLYGFGPSFGLPDASPFVLKAMVLLAISGLPHQMKRTPNPGQGPKGKLPYIDDDGTLVADSTFIRLHLEQKHGIDFDKGLSPAERGAAWALEKLCDDHLYWAILRTRWMNDEGFAKGPRQFFAKVPAPIRPIVTTIVRRGLRKAAWGHGFGRHSDAEAAVLTGRAVGALADCLGDKPFLGGEAPVGADATLFAFVASCLCPVFDAPERTAAESRPNLVAYRDRGMKRWFPALAAAP